MKIRSCFNSDLFRLWVALAILLGAGIPGYAVGVTVPATANPWLAGMPDGTVMTNGDIAPTQSPMPVTGVDMAPGASVFFRASGMITLGPGTNYVARPDGSSLLNSAHASQNGISGTTINHGALVGVFLGPGQPNLTPAPPASSFLPSQMDYLVLSPELKQIFLIGDGLTSLGVQQQVVVPGGASRLFLGVVDLRGPNRDNWGSFDVTVVPEPGTWSLVLVSGTLLVCGYALRRRGR